MDRLSAEELLREAFEVLHPYQGGSSDEANRKLALHEKIGRYLGEQGKPVVGGGAGGGAPSGGDGAYGPPAMFQGTTTFHVGNSLPTIISVSMVDRNKQEHEMAIKAGGPILTGSGGGGRGCSFSKWMFPDGHTETLPIDAEPEWPKGNPVRDAVDANR